MHTGSYIEGKWQHPKSERLVRNINPADTSDVLAEFPAATTADVERAIAAASAAFPGWRDTPGPERGRVLWRAADIARQRADEIARTLTREEGKIFKEAKGEVMKGISLLEFYAGEGFRMHGKTLPSEARDTFTYTIRRALGVFNMVVGSGSVVGEAMVAAKELRAISFTGSNEIGGALYVKAAMRGAKVTCEMGGKNAVIVMPDADLDKAAVAIHGGAFGSTGQRCTATSRVIAMPEIKAALVERLVAQAKKIKVGSGLEDGVDMGPAVDEKQWKTDLDYIDIGKREGARLVLGGGKPQHLDGGYFVEPTIFDEVTPAMRIFREEIFGPVLSVATAKSLDEALRFANAVDYGLTSSIFTENVDTIMRFVEGVETGMVHVNEPTIGGEAQLPFGGSKATGVGEREMAEEGLNFFTELKTVFINYSGKAERSMTR